MKGAPPDVDLQVFDQALGKLETLDARKARFIEMRYFAGLSNIEIAEATGSPSGPSSGSCNSAAPGYAARSKSTPSDAPRWPAARR